LHLVVFQTWTGQEVGYGSEPPGRTATLLECLHAVLRVQGGEEIEQNAEVSFPFLLFALSDPGSGRVGIETPRALCFKIFPTCNLWRTDRFRSKCLRFGSQPEGGLLKI